MTTRRRPKPRSRLALRSKEADVTALWASKDRDPNDLDRRAREFRAFLEAKKAGRLPMYEVVKPCR